MSMSTTPSTSTSASATTPAAALDAWVSARREEIERVLDARLPPPPDGDPGRLVEAMRYSLLAPGKRLRPLLALAAAETQMNGAPLDSNVVVACCAVELVHCYSLIHDDLPAMDDDDFRRGRPSNHKAFDEATAILAGDALLTLAFEWLAEAGTAAGRPAAFLAAAGALSRGAGARGMVRGQARDLREPTPADLATLELLHAEKTAALFRAAVEIGGAVGGAPETELAALAGFGERFGVAFQHADDLDDADHPAHAEAARARLEALVAEAVRFLAPLGARAERLAEFARRLLKRPTAPTND
ncbi:MAG TPA: polyprenyl synthetase family protein [Polyangia bacterium]|nr:polyprenyl synthetase family protein [Polyangia bacterium]